MLVLPHTHWDREWYHGAGRFRQRLVALMDELLDEPPPEGQSFLLDGQAVVLDDYLDVRTDRRDRLAATLAAARLEAGPWYVLADELIPSGEALVRNLLAGRRVVRRLGAEPPPLLYCPDSFGHPAALPALARGFGMDVILLWRGYGGARWPAGDTVQWAAPGGERALLHHLSPHGYELGSNLPIDGAAERWARMRAALAPRARLAVALVPNGADHHARQERQQAAIAALARAAAPEPVRVVSLRELARELGDRAEHVPLPVVRGELRDSYGYAWTLQGTFASRAGQKRRNALVERALLRECEPWVGLAWLVGAGAAHERHEGRRALLHAAWQTLLLCHPHDTLCGCSTDEVARAMDVRLEDALTQARGLRDDALLDTLLHDAVAARTRRANWVRSLVLRNAAPRARGGVAEVELLTFLRDVPVGPGSAATRGGAASARGAPVALAGGDVPLQLLGRSVRHDRVESPRHYPDDDLVEAARAVVWVPEVAGYGTRSWALDERQAPAVALPRGITPVTARDGALDNGLLRISVGADGVVSLAAPPLGRQASPLLSFEDVGDAGDLYTHSPVGKPIAAAWFLGARTVHRGPLRGELEARWRMRLPAARRGSADDAGGDPLVRAGRSAAHVEVTITVRLVLDAGAPFVQAIVAGTNRARDHRLRVVFGGGAPGARVRADAAFGPVARLPLVVPPEDRTEEIPPPTAPLHRYVTLHDDQGGVTLFSDGLAEYEATERGEIAVTLVRAVGELSRNDLPERRGHAGWPVAVPGAQSLGPFEGTFALMPHGPLDDTVADAIERCADDALLPLLGTTLRSALAVPAPTRGIELEGAGLAFSCAKPSEDGEWLVLRCVNVTDRAVAGRWRVGVPLREAHLARLDESAERSLRPRGEEVEFEAPPRAIVTLLVH